MDKKIKKFNRKTRKKLLHIKREYERIFKEPCNYLSLCILDETISFNNDYYKKEQNIRIEHRYWIKTKEETN